MHHIIKPVKNSLFIKIFLAIFFMLFSVCLGLFFSLQHSLPQVYIKNYQNNFTPAFIDLVESLKTCDINDFETYIVTFCIDNRATVSLSDATGNIILNMHYNEDGSSASKTASESTINVYDEFMNANNPYLISASSVVENSKGITIIFKQLFPSFVVLTFLISLGSALFLSRFLTLPIRRISSVSKRMAKLDFTWHCSVNRSDEIGILARNLNTMAEKLAISMQNLHDTNIQLSEEIAYREQQEQQKMDFFMSISHELKTPLTVLLGMLEGMKLNIGRYRDRDKYLCSAYETALNMNHMVQELLAVSQIQNKDFYLIDETVNLSELIWNCCENHLEMARQHEIIIINLVTDKICCTGHSSEIEKAFSNIICNGIRYSPSGSEVVIRASISANDALISIENTNTQINNTDLEYIFHPLYRVDKSRNSQTGGNGLGLYLTKKIFDKHGFEISVKNFEDRVCFQIKIPHQQHS